MPLFIKLAVRELRGGLKGFYIALACLIVSSFTLTASNSFTQALTAALQKEGKVILGGDAELSRVHLNFSAQEKNFFSKESKAVSFISSMRVMTRAKKENSSALLKAIDGAYPLVGKLELQEQGELKTLLAFRSQAYGVIAAPSLLAALDIQFGDKFTIGKAQFQLRGLIQKEPDGLADGLPFQPKIIVSHQALAATQLVQFGSLITYRARFVLHNPQGFSQRAARAFPKAGWRCARL